jgi:hypothetical protein
MAANFSYTNSPDDDGNVVRSHQEEMKQERGRERYWVWATHDQRRKQEQEQDAMNKPRRLVRKPKR